MVANYLPHSLVALDQRRPGAGQGDSGVGNTGKTSRVSAVYDARPRNSFIAALKDIPEVWEIPYDGRPVYKGLVHDYRLKEAIPEPGPLPVRHIVLDDYLDDFFFDQNYDYILGASRTSPKGQVIHLGAGRKIADLDLAGMPHLGSGITWDWLDAEGKTRRVMASPNLKDGLLSVIDMKTWKTIKTIPPSGPASSCAATKTRPTSGPTYSAAEQGRHARDRQAETGNRRKPAPGTRQDRDARRIRPLRQIRAGVDLGNGRRADRLRRADPERNQAPADETRGRQIQRLEQDTTVGGNQPLRDRY
jgi:hypothetical protein